MSVIDSDIIHLMEIPELFMANPIADEIYETWPCIIETTHSSTFDLSLKRNLPSAFRFVCEFSRDQYAERFDVPEEIVEMEIPDKPTADKLGARRALKLDKLTGRHVLNVGLFTPGKNQAQAFEIARKAPTANFHFVGNQAPNFKDYWEPLLKDKPGNCYLWGERADVDTFYMAADEFLFTSLTELNPLVIKEALSRRLLVRMHRLKTYGDKYDNNPLVTYL